jgi:hypothetical protein
LSTVFLITPPFTQLNTPYPATAYLKGFFNTRNISAFQADLGIEVTLALFSKEGLSHLFGQIDARNTEISDNARRIIALRHDYIQTIDAVVSFLQGKDPSLAHLVLQKEFPPRGIPFQAVRRPVVGLRRYGYTGQGETPGHHVP